MIVRYGGGVSGIGEYLIAGRKAGREETRDQLDDRLILDGDLDITQQIIKGMQTEGDRYLHITLSFSERDITSDSIRLIVQEFRDFLMTGYKVDEYNWYAEAHLPRIQGYRDAKTGDLISRFSHIHVVLPKVNLLADSYLNPVGLVRNTEKYLDAWQESINQRYGFSSPKDIERRRNEGVNQGDFISRSKGDEFILPQADLRNKILTEVLNRDIRTQKDLGKYLSSLGEVRLRNADKPGSYFNLKVVGATKGINLKGDIYKEEFLSLSAAKKKEFLAGNTDASFPERPKRTLLENQVLIQEWREHKALEIKYIKADKRKYSVNGKEAKRYADMDKKDQQQLVQDQHRVFHEKWFSTPDVDFEEELLPTWNQERVAIADLQLDPPEIIKPAVSVSERAQIESQRKNKQDRAEILTEWQEIKRNLDAHRLLSYLVKTHGLQLERYPITSGKDGGSRIQVGNRNLNVADFLTKEMHLEWSDASKILREVWTAQIGHEPVKKLAQISQEYWNEFITELRTTGKEQRAEEWTNQRTTEKERRIAIKNRFQLNWQELYSSSNRKKTTPEERRQRLSCIQMERVKDEMNARTLTINERVILRQKHKRPIQELFIEFLEQKKILEVSAEQIQEIERIPAEEALEKKKRIKTEDRNGARGTFAAPVFPAFIELTNRIDPDGSITYLRKGEAIIRDSGKEVFSLVQDDQAFETFLRFSADKFGKTLCFVGSDDFIEKAIQTAVDKGIKLELSDERQAIQYQKAFEQAALQTDNSPKKQGYAQSPQKIEGSEKPAKVEKQKLPVEKSIDIVKAIIPPPSFSR